MTLQNLCFLSTLALDSLLQNCDFTAFISPAFSYMKDTLDAEERVLSSNRICHLTVADPMQVVFCQGNENAVP